MTTSTGTSDMTLGGLQATMTTILGGATASLDKTMSGLNDATNIGVTDMTNLQIQMSSYTIAANTVSGVVKDVSDTIKGTVRNIG